MIRLISLVLWAACAAASAGEPPAGLKLSQARAMLPAMVAYLDVRDAHGNPVGGLNSGQFRATLGDKTVPVEQVTPFRQTGEGVAYIFLVDVSKSVKADFFARIRGALNDWIDALAGPDRMAVVSFGETVERVADFTANKAALKAKIAALQPQAKQTALHAGLIQAMQLGQRADADLPGRRVVVVLSDGLDDLFGGPTRDEVSQQMRTDRVPVYAIGLDKPPVTGKRKEGIEALGRFARESGGDYVSSANRPIEQVYGELRTRIKEVLVARLNCAACTADGGAQRLQFTLQADGLALSDGLDLRVLPPPPPPTPVEPEPDYRWLYLGGGVLLMVLAGGIVFARRRGKVEAGTPPPVTYDPPEPVPYTPEPPVVPSPPPSVPTSRVRLVQVRGPQPGQEYRVEFSGEASIGRTQACKVVIDTDSEISSRHCALVKKDQALFVRDLGSTNGTQVNGVPIANDYALQDGDVIGIGRTELRILMQGKSP
jgi:VWFA-related protein